MEKIKFDIQDANWGHLEALALEMREQGKVEMQSHSEVSNLETLKILFENSEEIKVVFKDNKLIGAFGVGLKGQDICPVWFLGTDNINKYTISFLKESREILKMLLEKHGHIFSLVSVKNKLSVKWLKWLGFMVSDDVEFLGPKLSPFYRVYIEEV